MITIRHILVIALGSAAGGILRYVIGKLVSNAFPTQFPWPTLSVNLLGCLLMGLLFGWFDRGLLSSAETRLLLATGFCGGFTTFSAFAIENIQLIRSGSGQLALTYTVLSVVLGLAVTFVGMRIAS